VERRKSKEQTKVVLVSMLFMAGMLRVVVCVSEILAIQIWFNLSKCRNFKTLYRRANGEFLRQFFPRMPNCSSFMKQIKRQAKTFHFIGKIRRSKGTFYIDSTPLPAFTYFRSCGITYTGLRRRE
jgi:hypothetical protein